MKHTRYKFLLILCQNDILEGPYNISVWTMLLQLNSVGPKRMRGLNFSWSNQHVDQTWNKISCCLHDINGTCCGVECRVPANSTATQIWPIWWKLRPLLLLAMEPWSRKISMMDQRGLGEAVVASTSCTGWFNQMQFAGSVVILEETAARFSVGVQQSEDTSCVYQILEETALSFFQRNKDRYEREEDSSCVRQI